MLFAFFAAMGETERENIREATLEGLDAAARKGKNGVRPAVITAGMLYTVLRRRAAGETDLFIPAGKRTGRNPSVASIYRALAVYGKSQACPDAVEQARACRSRATPGYNIAVIMVSPALGCFWITGLLLFGIQ